MPPSSFYNLFPKSLDKSDFFLPVYVIDIKSIISFVKEKILLSVSAQIAVFRNEIFPYLFVRRVFARHICVYFFYPGIYREHVALVIRMAAKSSMQSATFGPTPFNVQRYLFAASPSI